MHIELFGEFVVLAEELNYHAAARRLNVAQSTLSKHIAVLEREYGTALFARNRGGVTLTASGSVLLESAKEICDAFERSRRLMAPRERKALYVAGELDSPSAYPVVSRAVGAFMTRDSSCVPHIVSSPSLALEAVVGTLSRGEVDCAVLSVDHRALSATGLSDEVAVRRLFRSPFVAVVAPTNPLARKGLLHLSDLAGCTLMQLVGPRFSPSWKVIERQFRTAKVPFATAPFAALTPYDFMGIDLLSSVLLIPVASGIPSPDLLGGAATVPIAREELCLDMSAIWLTDSPMAGKVGEFADALEEAYRELWGE